MSKSRTHRASRPIGHAKRGGSLSKIDKARFDLEEMVSQSKLIPGARFPPERDLCQILGVSRSTLRFALDMLEAEGKIWRRIGSGTYVGKAPPKALEGLISISESTNPIELMELRLILEPPIARLAALHATDAEINHMKYCVKKCFAAQDSEAHEVWDAALHNAVAAATHNRLIISTFKSINELRKLPLWSQIRDHIISGNLKRNWCVQHKLFVNAIADRNAALAEDLARKHVEELREKMLKASLVNFTNGRTSSTD